MGQISADNNEEFIWEAADKTLVVDLIDASLKTAEDQLNYGKTAYLNGNNGLLKLQGDINQGLESFILTEIIPSADKIQIPHGQAQEYPLLRENKLIGKFAITTFYLKLAAVYMLMEPGKMTVKSALVMAPLF
ncbi:hypothetical protein [Aggregatibacter segnis]|uniref:hypothetical protein n=1 Tax=Aggregatibacter segnis TaxID=739 RepID=UPI003F9FE7D4